MRSFWVYLIALYQNYISPHKGYRCAYSVLHGGHGCSGAVKEIILAEGLFKGWPKIRVRFQNCKTASLKLKRQRRKKDKDRDNERNSRCEYCECANCIPCGRKSDGPGLDCDLPCDCSF